MWENARIIIRSHCSPIVYIVQLEPKKPEVVWWGREIDEGHCGCRHYCLACERPGMYSEDFPPKNNMIFRNIH